MTIDDLTDVTLQHKFSEVHTLITEHRFPPLAPWTNRALHSYLANILIQSGRPNRGRCGLCGLPAWTHEQVGECPE